jgi:hypothetical protein
VQPDGHLTADGKTLVYSVTNQSGSVKAIYSVSIDGSNTKKVMDLDGSTKFCDAY